jgi:cyclopropane-fatty-acyl-phospholipid synthase
MDENRDAILPVLEATYGTDDAVVWFNRWRMFHIACSELFGFEDGEEWFVSHYLFSKTGNA